ncbi:MAG TPA: DUF2784 domain-containing protein [Nevskiaceae bacterium]|nr:DUF2784 domain-containing protein [Nevskiaceae bacterium]
MLALSVLLVHVAIIVFNVAGLVLVPIGAWRHWRWVREFWWRLAHLLSLAVVALQAVAGRACFLTIWQADLSGAAAPPPLIAHWINQLIYWPLPLWVFAVIYVLVWLYMLALWMWIRPLSPWRARRT